MISRKQKRGLVVTFLGPDGAGKSTLMGKVREALAADGSRIHQYYFAPGFLKRYRPRSDQTTTTAPHAARQYPGWLAAAKVLLFLYEFNLGTRIERRKYDILLFDRYIHDILVDPIRYKLGRVTWWKHRLLKWAPVPDLVVIVIAPAATIRTRKQEVPLDETVRQLDAYERLAGSFAQSLVVDNRGDIDSVASLVITKLRGLRG